MDVAAFERVHECFGEFHGFFAAAFGRKQWREHSRHYLQALLVQSQERRNAENLSETVPASARAMQRFLTEARWDEDAIIGRLQEYLGSRLEHPQAVWVSNGSDFPKQGVKSVGVARQYCGALGKIANCQAGVFLAHAGPRGRALVDQRPYLPEEWNSDAGRWALRVGWSAGRSLAIPVKDGAGLGDAGTGTGARPHERSVGRRRFRLRDVSVFPGGSGGSGGVVRAGREAEHDGLAAGASLGQPTLSRIWPPSQAQIAERGAADRGRALPGAAGGSLTGGGGGGGNTGAKDLYVQRPAGTGNAAP